MKKLLMVLMVTLFTTTAFSGCESKEEEANDVKDVVENEEVTLTVDEYYTIVTDTLASDKEATFSGSNVGGGLPSSPTEYFYNGKLSSNTLNVNGEYSGLGTQEGENQFEFSTDIISPTDDAKNWLYDSGVLDLGNIDVNECSVDSKTMTCIIEEIEEVYKEPINANFYDTSVTGKKTTFTFEFDDDNELKKVTIDYTGVEDWVKLTEHPENNVVQVVEEFFDTADKEAYVKDGSHLVNGNFFYGNATLEY